MSALSVAFLSHMASPASPTGAERSLALLAAGMHRRGHAVRLVVPGPWALESTLREAGVPVVRLPCRACWLVHSQRRALAGSLLRWMRYAWPDPGARRLARELRRDPPDVVHVNCLPHLRGARAASAAGLPVVWHVREILPAGSRRRWFARQLSRHAARIVAVSSAVAGWLDEEGLGDRTEVVHNGVEVGASTSEKSEARRRLGLPEDGCLVGLFGQLVPHKGATAFVSAAGSALARNPGLNFVVAGPGTERQIRRVRAAIAATARPERFHLLPPQPTAELLLDATDVLCLASLTADPLPRSILEAMARGIPVAAFRGGGVTELVRHGETGLLVDVGDLDGLAAAFVQLGEDAALRQRLGRAGRMLAEEEFSLDRHLCRMESLLFDARGAS